MSKSKKKHQLQKFHSLPPSELMGDNVLDIILNMTQIAWCQRLNREMSSAAVGRLVAYTVDTTEKSTWAFAADVHCDAPPHLYEVGLHLFIKQLGRAPINWRVEITPLTHDRN